MANVTATNPMRVDTAGVLRTGPVTIKAIFIQYVTNGDDVLLSDADGNVVFKSKGGPAIETTQPNNTSLVVPGGNKVNGLTCTTIDGTTEATIYLQ